MTAGRKALTPEMRRALGRPLKKQTDKTSGLSVPTALPEPPKMLDHDACEEWGRIGRFLLTSRRVSELDRQALTAYCVSWSIFGQAIRPLLIGRQRLWSMLNGRPKPAKAEEIARQHGAVVINMARRFGMTARTRHLDHATTGRPALPDELHSLRGNPSKKKLKSTSIESVAQWLPEDVSPPYWFDRTATSEWHRMISQLEKIDCWTPLDVAVLAIGCGSYALTLRAAEELKDVELVASTESGAAVEHPLSLIIRRQQELLVEAWRDYGMSPLDRSRFKHAGGEAQGKAKLKVYLGK